MASAHKVLWFPPDRPVEGNTVFVRGLALEAAERELDAAQALLDYFGVSEDEVYDRYIAALEARNALRDGRP